MCLARHNYDHIEWQHGIPKSGKVAKLAKDAGVNVHDRKWGYYMEKQDHRLLKGEGLHTTMGGTKKEWNQEWGKWADGLKKSPTEKDFAKQYKTLMNDPDFKDQYSRGAPADMDYADKNGKAKKGTWTSSTPLDSSAKQTHARSVMAAHGESEGNALTKSRSNTKTKATMAAAAGSLFLISQAKAETSGANNARVKNVKNFMKRVQLSQREQGHHFSDLDKAGLADDVNALFGNQTAALRVWNHIDSNLP